MQSSAQKNAAQMDPDFKTLAQMRAEAFVHGAKFVLAQQGNGSLEMKKRMDALLSETKRIIAQAEVQSPHYSRIVNQLIKQLSRISGLKTQEIELSEAYWAWQIYSRPERKTQVDFPEVDAVMHLSESVIKPQLTLIQKKMLIQIHQRPKPSWVNQLLVWEQHYLKKIIPHKMAGDWSSYERVLPATLRRIPGVSNATQKTVTFVDSTGNTVIKRGYRQGVPTAYAMPSAYYKMIARENIKQMVNAIQTDVKKDFQAYWDLSKSSTIKAPLLLLGLLTHKKHGNTLQALIDSDILYSGVTLSGEENNTHRTQDKSVAIDAIQKQAKYRELTLIDLNVGVNTGRGWLSGVPVDNFITQMEQLFRSIQASTPLDSDRIKKRVQEAEDAIEALKAHNVKALSAGRNKDLFTAALCHYVTEKLGGSVVTNCKSAKDRTGLEIIMADAIDVYARSYAELPQYDETDLEKRERFLRIFKAIFHSQHHQLIASDNSPGSQGIKDEGMLDIDIAESLGGAYTLGRNIAALNKPKSFFEKNKKMLLGAFLFLGTIASIGLIGSGVFAPLGLVVGYGVLSIGLPYAITLGIFGGYAAYDARQNFLATKKYAEIHMSEQEVSLLSPGDDHQAEEDAVKIPKSKGAADCIASKPVHSTRSRGHGLFKSYSESEVEAEGKTVEVRKNRTPPLL